MALPQMAVTLADGTTETQPKPLEIKIDLGELSIGDTRLLTGRLNQANLELIAQFGDFLIAHTNWTEQEVNQIRSGEMESVMEQVKNAFAEQTVPNANGASSKNLQGAKRTKRRTGSMR